MVQLIVHVPVTEAKALASNRRVQVKAVEVLDSDIVPVLGNYAAGALEADQIGA